MAERPIDRAVRELSWYFISAEYECEMTFAHAIVAPWVEVDSQAGVGAISKARTIRNRLRAIGRHADVLAAAYTPRQHGPRLADLYGKHPGVAARTLAANDAFAESAPTGDSGKPHGIWTWLGERKHKDATMLHIEGARLLRDAHAAYIDARPRQALQEAA